MTVSLRLEPKLAAELDVAAEREGISKSELIRRCLETYLAEQGGSRLVWELGRDRFGKQGSGRSDLSKNRKKILKAKIHARKGRC